MADPSQHTAAFKIFHYYYKCWIAQHYIVTNDLNMMFGIPTTGQREVDRELANSKMLVQLTINEMTEYFDRGANITLENQADAVTIYEIVHQHLHDWKQAASFEVSRMDIPVEDFRKLDAFAAEVFRLAKGQMKEAPKTGKLANKLSQLEGGRRAFARKTKQEKAELVPTEHKPLSEDIGKENFRRTNRYR